MARKAALDACEVLTRHAALPRVAESKADGSPVTAADREANAAIIAEIRSAFPDDSILSEESPDDPSRLGRRRVWIVDPLDGTRDFVNGTPDYAVHVALVIGGKPEVAAVAHPAERAVYLAQAGKGTQVERNDQIGTPSVSTRSKLGEIRVGVSRLSLTSRLSRMLEETPLGANVVRMGASVKWLAVATGALDAVITLSGTDREWDSCAPGLVVVEAGGMVTDIDGAPLRYNQPEPRHRRGIIISNGHCHEALRELAIRYGIES